MINKDKRTYVLLAGGVLIGVLFLLFSHFHSKETTNDLWNTPTIHDAVLTLGNTHINVRIARTDIEREQGLSGTPALPDSTGELFVFDTPGEYGFWMKDMHYSLDFIWIRADHSIAGITPDVPAESYPKVFYPPAPVKYVLEVPAGFSTTHALSSGEVVILKK